MRWDSMYSILLHAQIKLLVGSIRLNDTVGKLIRLQLQWIQVLAGVKTPVLECTQIIPYIPRGWVQCLHHMLVSDKIKIQVANAWSPIPRRENDEVIMDYVMRHLPQQMWQSINQCRLFLQALTFSDITTYDGAEIPIEIYNVQFPYRKSSIKFPIQIKPSKAAVEQWQYLIRYFTKDRRLYSALGE